MALALHALETRAIALGHPIDAEAFEAKAQNEAYMYQSAAQAALSALPPTRAESGLVKELRAELRHFKGRLAVDGKPLELQTRDELLTVVHGLQAENDRLGFEANAGRQAEAEADAEARELAEALRFYADPKNWWTRNVRSSGCHNTNMEGSMERYSAQVGVFDTNGNWFNDVGDRARAVLAKHAAQSKAGV